MTVINNEKCIGCGSCISDCVFGALKIENGKATLDGQCIKCGHCVAICPSQAVSIPEYEMSEVEDYDRNRFAIDMDNLLYTIKFRRSIRHFTEQPVEHEKLENIVQVGRYTATGVNRQSCRFVVVQDSLKELKTAIWNGIDEALKQPDSFKEDDLKSLQRLSNWRTKNIDFLFRNAPVAIYIAADSVVDAALAAQNMELAAISQGLGVFYNGYLVWLTSMNPVATEMLDFQGKQIAVCMMVGYPNVKYQRTAPRRKADVVWK